MHLKINIKLIRDSVCSLYSIMSDLIEATYTIVQGSLDLFAVLRPVLRCVSGINYILCYPKPEVRAWTRFISFFCCVIHSHFKSAYCDVPSPECMNNKWGVIKSYFVTWKLGIFFILLFYGDQVFCKEKLLHGVRNVSECSYSDVMFFFFEVPKP